MSTHTLVITLDKVEQARLDAGELVYPEHPDSHDWHVQCDDPPRCHGWSECSRMHICKHGHEIVHDELSIDGSCPGVDYGNCIDQEEAQFHGEWHTWRWGWGWTVPFHGCVVAECWDGELGDTSVYELPIGQHPVDDDWYDESCVSLELIEPVGSDK